MAARPGGYATKAEQAKRLAIVREMWFDNYTLEDIAERLRIHTSSVSMIAKAGGLPARRRGTGEALHSFLDSSRSDSNLIRR
jgi:hypothetical protein